MAATCVIYKGIFLKSDAWAIWAVALPRRQTIQNSVQQFIGQDHNAFSAGKQLTFLGKSKTNFTGVCLHLWRVVHAATADVEVVEKGL
jgi:hypothetical protein